MKKFLAIAFALSMVLGVASFVRISRVAEASPAALPQGAPLKTIQGTVKVDGDKVMFISDEDKKSWGVMNPETLKAHDGHHVEVSAHIYADKNQIHVMSVKMAK